jgi:type I restriction enzyme R subunit
LSSDLQLRSKKELIEKFMQTQLPLITDSDAVIDEFEKFVVEERKIALTQLSVEEQLDAAKMERLIGEYIYNNKAPLREDVVNSMLVKPKLTERGPKIERIINHMYSFVNTYISGFGG